MRRNLILAALVLLVPLAWANAADTDRGFLGVSLQLTESIHEDGVLVQDGAGMFVSHVMSGGPADLAGLRADDRIVAIDGHEVSNMDDLKRAMMTTRSGDRISVTVERDDGEQEQTFGVVLGNLPEKHTHVERFGVAVEQLENRAFVGIESQPVEAELAEYFGVDGGILVTRVVEGTPAQEAGLEAGDVIVAWEDTPLRTRHDVHQAISGSKPGDEVELSVSRRGVESKTFVTLGAASDHVAEDLYELHNFHELHQRAGESEFHENKRHFRLKVKETKRGGE